MSQLDYRRIERKRGLILKDEKTIECRTKQGSEEADDKTLICYTECDAVWITDTDHKKRGYKRTGGFRNVDMEKYG